MVPDESRTEARAARPPARRGRRERLAGVLRALVIFAFAGPARGQAPTLTLGTPNNFLPPEAAPVLASQASLRFTFDGAPGTYQVDAVDTTFGAAVATRMITKTTADGTPSPFIVLVPLEEGSQRFRVRVTGITGTPGTVTSADSAAITRDLLRGVSAITLDAVEPNRRSSNLAQVTLTFTLSGTSQLYSVTIERNGGFAGTVNVTGTGEMTATASLEADMPNTFQLRARAADFGADPLEVASNVLTVVQDGTAPAVQSLRITGTTNPTPDAVVSVQGRTEAFADVEVDNGQGDTFRTQADLLGNFTVVGVFVPLLPPGPTASILTATARDSAGNLGVSSSVSVTRVDDEPRLDFALLEPPSGSILAPGVPVSLQGAASGQAEPLTVTLLTRVGSAGSFEVSERITDLLSGTPFSQDFLPAFQVVPPSGDVLYSVQAQVSSTAGATNPQLVGQIVLDTTDPPPPGFSNRFNAPLFTNARLVTVEGQAERFALVEFGTVDGLDYPLGNAVLVESTPALEGGEFVQLVDLGLVQDDDVELAVPLRTVARSGRSGGGSERSIRITRDTRAPEVVRLEVNDVDSSINRDLFVREGQVVRLKVFVSEPMPTPPDVVVTERGQDGFPAALDQVSPGNQIFTYVYATSFNTGLTPDDLHDGPVEVVVSGGADRAGNPIDPESRVPGAFDKDSLPPVIDRVRVLPPVGSPVNEAPRPLFIRLAEHPLSEDPASGIDIGRTLVEVLGPLEVDPTRVITGQAVPISPDTVEFFFAPGSVIDPGTYVVRVTVFDVAGNTDTPSLTLRLDTEPIDASFLRATDPAGGTCLNRDTFPRVMGRDSVSATFDPAILSQVSLDRTTMAVTMFCPQRRSVAGSTVTSPPDSVRFVLDRDLRSRGEDDGLYVTEVFIRDIAGNLTPFVNNTFVYDTTAPFVLDGLRHPAGNFGIQGDDRIFPADRQVVGGPLRTISAEIVDGVATNGYTGCGIDTNPVTGTSVSLTLIATHPTTTLLPGSSPDNDPDLAGTIRFESLSPSDSSPCFVGLRRTRILLELRTDPVTGVPRGLRSDGTHDGRFAIFVTPVDRAGNQGPMAGAEFIYDSIPPVITLDSVKSDEFITSSTLSLTGTARDNFKPPEDAGQGVTEILVTLERAGPTGATTQPALISMQPAVLPPNLRFLPAAETFRWRFEGFIPPYRGRARLVVRAKDLAGNITDLVRDVQVDTGRLPAPRLVAPADESFTANVLVRFAWDQIDGASRYRVTITDPGGDRIEVETPPEENFVTVSLEDHPEGEYTWTVQALDSQGVPGLPADMLRFGLDLTRPTFLALFGFDPVPVDIDGGTILGNQVRVGITFSEPMDEATTPTVRVQPANRDIPPVELTPIVFRDREYRGLANLTPGPDAADVNGIAQVDVLGAFDRAGNPLLTTAGFLELRLGPFFEIRAFANPIHRRELKFHVKGLTHQGGPPERLLGVPFVRVTQESGTPQTLAMSRIHESVFAGVYTVDPTRSGTAAVEVHGADPAGNGITRRLTFRIQDVVPLSLASVRGVSDAFYLELPRDRIGARTTFYAFAPEMSSSIPAAAGAAAGSGGEVRVLAHLGSIEPGLPGPKLRAVVDLERLGTASARQGSVGLFRVQDGALVYQASRREGGRIEGWVDPALGTFVLGRDETPPSLELVEPVPRGDLVELARSGARLTLRAADPGSGVDPGSLRVRIGSTGLGCAGLDPDGVGHLDLPRDLAPGEHTLELEASDRLGNVTRRTWRMEVPRELDVLQFVPVPNPARLQAILRYRLTRAASTATLDIHDVTGRRIRRLPATADPGPNEVLWDLSTRNGSPVGTGVYLVILKVEGDGRRVTRHTKVAVVR